jgi:hypothetical protein
VWTPDVNDGGKRPVMVSFHDGGYTTGSGSHASLPAVIPVLDVYDLQQRTRALPWLRQRAPPLASSSSIARPLKSCLRRPLASSRFLGARGGSFESWLMRQLFQ